MAKQKKPGLPDDQTHHILDHPLDGCRFLSCRTALAVRGLLLKRMETATALAFVNTYLLTTSEQVATVIGTCLPDQPSLLRPTLGILENLVTRILIQNGFEDYHLHLRACNQDCRIGDPPPSEDAPCPADGL